jgi:hypothetical protein
MREYHTKELDLSNIPNHSDTGYENYYFDKDLQHIYKPQGNKPKDIALTVMIVSFILANLTLIACVVLDSLI